MKLEDMGTRYKHYTELLDLWETGEAILDSRYGAWEDPNDLNRLCELRLVASFMRKQIDIMANYAQTAYSVAKLVDEPTKLLKDIN